MANLIKRDPVESDVLFEERKRITDIIYKNCNHNVKLTLAYSNIYFNVYGLKCTYPEPIMNRLAELIAEPDTDSKEFKEPLLRSGTEDDVASPKPTVNTYRVCPGCKKERPIQAFMKYLKTKSTYKEMKTCNVVCRQV
uniref:Uncharacterized protein n=1 Tax=viral metagenome TaxID=1070528 RepID=A0A6C0CM34_9ZZZZ